VDKYDALQSLYCVVKSDATEFILDAHLAVTTETKSAYDRAMKRLDTIEDAIKRFRDGRPQSYQED
jgi:hypothetical protein